MSTAYGADIGNYYFKNRFTALFIPNTKHHNDLSSLMEGLKSTIADKPIYEHSELHHILRLLHEKADVDISDFNIIPNLQRPLSNMP
jgi:hypothetical protein